MWIDVLHVLTLLIASPSACVVFPSCLGVCDRCYYYLTNPHAHTQTDSESEVEAAVAAHPGSRCGKGGEREGNVMHIASLMCCQMQVDVQSTHGNTVDMCRPSACC